MRIKNNESYVKQRIRLIGGHLTGIWDHNSFFVGDSPYPLPCINYVTANLINVPAVLYNNNVKIFYHLSGYGSSYEEAKLSFLGESSERYAFSVMPATLKQDIVSASYVELVTKYGKDSVLPLEYINIFSDSTKYLKTDDVIEWVKMRSVLFPEKSIFEPLPLVMFTAPSKNQTKQLSLNAVSTGTASHETIKQAFENSLIEYLQVDSYNLWWYGGHTGKKIDVDVKSFLYRHFGSSMSDFLKRFEICFTDISFDKPLWIVVCEIFGKGEQTPKYTVGIQGAYDLEKALYRGLMETLTEMAYSINLSWMDSELLKKAPNLKGQMKDLDTNVAYYALHEKPHLVANQKKLDSSKKASNLVDLVNYSQKLLKWAAVVNITPVEFENLNLNVTRLLAPAMLPICLPSFPPTRHPRYLETGGILNEYEHPMA